MPNKISRYNLGRNLIFYKCTLFLLCHYAVFVAHNHMDINVIFSEEDKNCGVSETLREFASWIYFALKIHCTELQISESVIRIFKK